MIRTPTYVLVLALATAACSSQEQRQHSTPSAQRSPFALPIRCNIADKQVHCLADSVRPGLTVVMLKADGTSSCTVKTSRPFVVKDHPVREINATLLEQSENCPGTYRIAYIPEGGQEASLRHVAASETVLTSDKDIGARQLMAKLLAECAGCEMFYPSDDQPRSSTTGDYTLLVYALKAFPKGRGILFRNDIPYALEGACTTDHAFFTVSGRLHLTYAESGCDGGIHVVHVYDLSAQKPVHVYANGVLST